LSKFTNVQHPFRREGEGRRYTGKQKRRLRSIARSEHNITNYRKTIKEA
jgi:hypothetical protein